MNALSGAWTPQLLSTRPDHPNWLSVILWWEIRRIPYNIVVGLVGFASLISSFFLIIASGVLEPGEDAIEPVAMIFGPFLAAVFFNICYTAGWVCEVLVRGTSDHQRAP